MANRIPLITEVGPFTFKNTTGTATLQMNVVSDRLPSSAPVNNELPNSFSKRGATLTLDACLNNGDKVPIAVFGLKYYLPFKPIEDTAITNIVEYEDPITKGNSTNPIVRFTNEDIKDTFIAMLDYLLTNGNFDQLPNEPF